MITRYKALSFGLCITTTFLFFSVAISADPPLPQLTDNPACVLNFTSFPYEPSGECIGKREIVKTWASTRTNLCCQNLLRVLSQSLALQATLDEGNIFLNQDQWLNCSAPFKRQDTVSIESCKFTNLFYGNSKCSSLSLARIRQDPSYQNASTKCDGFNDSYDDTCTNCTQAIMDARDGLLKNLGATSNDTEKEICGIAIVIAFTARNMNEISLIGDLYRCLHYINVFDPGYIKIKSSAVMTCLGIVIAVLALVLIIVLIKHVTKNNKSKRKQVQTKETAMWSGLYRFSKSEIENAMNFGGNERECLGSGSAGQVYKGVLPSGQVVAIKHIYKSNTSDTFNREVEGLSRVRHPNLVCLFGYCAEDGEQYLVYEYCSAGNLSHHLSRKDNELTWGKRVKILRDCALALRYLHHYIDGCIVHRDIKLTNILLTEKLEPKLSDFGLARILGMEESKVFTDVRGTIGYMDPEYMSNAKLTCASDVYSFGIVALQLLSGQKVIELDLEARDQLTRKAKDVSMGKRPLTDFQDPRLNGNLKTVDFESILQIAVLCAAKSSKGRPTIDVVFEEMDKAWKNTSADMRRKELSSSATPQSRSIEYMPV